MFSKVVVPGSVLVALALSGCGGGPSTAGTPSATESSPVVRTVSSSAPVDPGASASAPGTGASAAEVRDPCTVLDAERIADLTGVEVAAGSSSTVASSKLCTWTPKDTRASDAAVISAQEGPLPGPLSQVETQLESEFGGKVTNLTVPGADDARYVTGTKSGLNVIDVLAQKDDVFFQVLVASPRDVKQHKAGAVKVAAALVAG